jgi:hypothetical protein
MMPQLKFQPSRFLRVAAIVERSRSLRLTNQPHEMLQEAQITSVTSHGKWVDSSSDAMDSRAVICGTS